MQRLKGYQRNGKPGVLVRIYGSERWFFSPDGETKLVPDAHGPQVRAK
jgi:hypothetical protein